ncbi:hypothetical protein M5689_005318 [Euphorbia peplus]|nr:hypothetical protein M5689_005318 [Euphorbia peplus]
MSSLILSDNNLSGSISPLLFTQDDLNYLDLSRNNFSGYLPENIGEATSLEILILSSNDFSGPIPKSISAKQLKLLDLSKNRLSTNEFPNFEFLYVLDLSFNLLFGEIPVNFSNWMTMLVLCNNNFSGVFPTSLASLNSLLYLDLHENNLIGKIPDFLFQISVLRILDLSNNYFQGHIPNNLSKLIQILDVSGNKLSGSVPAGLGNLNGMIGYNHDLKHHLRVPFLDGSIPSQVIQINYPDLEVFWKETKRNLPNEHLGIYTLLDLSNNQLSGKIPDTLGYLRNLKLLNFSHNKLSGRIPSTINGLENLESLDLSYNNLSGKIPEAIGKLSQLSTLKLSNNKLEGPIPTGPQMDRLNDPKSYADNNRLCGMQIRVPCDKLPPDENGKEKDEESMEDWCFSWKTTAIGFPSGFLSTVLVLYITGYFNLLSKRQLRRRGRRRQYIMPRF